MNIYCSDTFDENTPPVDDPEYISSLAAAIYKGMESGDDNAVWLMQVNYKSLIIRFFLWGWKNVNETSYDALSSIVNVQPLSSL